MQLNKTEKFLIQLNPWMGWFCLCVQKIQGWKKGSRGYGGKTGTISFGSGADFRWVFNRHEIAQVHRLCPVRTSLQILIPCPGQGALPAGSRCAKQLQSSATTIFMVYFETVVFKSGHSVMGAARRHNLKGQQMVVQGGVVVAGWWSELLHPVLSPKVARCVIAPIPYSVLLYNKQWRH